MPRNNEGKLQLIYIFPNLFTAASAFIGIASVILASKGQYEKAAIYILLALILDGLDGRVARLTKTTSKFGVEFDSLADIISFGVAPSMLLYFSIANNYGRFGTLVVALFVVFGAIRLARFNVMSSTSEPSVFIGLPIPTAAVCLTLWILMWQNYPLIQEYQYLFLVGQLILSLLMVSNIRYPSFKKVDFRKANVIKILIFLSILLSTLYLYPVECATFLVTSYLIYGLFRAFYTVLVAKCKKNKYNE